MRWIHGLCLPIVVAAGCVAAADERETSRRADPDDTAVSGSPESVAVAACVSTASAAPRAAAIPLVWCGCVATCWGNNSTVSGYGQCLDNPPWPLIPGTSLGCLLGTKCGDNGPAIDEICWFD